MENIIAEEEKSKGFELKRYFSKLGKNYLWFILSVPIFIAAAYMYILYTIPVYEVTTNVLIKQPTENSSKLGSAFTPGVTALTGTGDPNNDVNNEIFKLKSAAVASAVVDSLQLEMQLAKKGKERNQPLDITTFPVRFTLIKSSPAKESPVYDLKLSDKGYTLTSANSKINGTYNQELTINGDKLLLQLRDNNVLPEAGDYEFNYISKQKAVIGYIFSLSISPVSKGGMGLLQIVVSDPVPERAKNSITYLVHSYDIQNLDYNNQALIKERAFLQERLASAGAELQAQENMVRDFKAGNQIMDVSASANQLLSSLPTIDTKKSDNQLRQEMLNLVEQNVKSYDGKEEIVPNSSGLQDPVMADQLNKYNQLVLAKRRVMDNGTAQDPRLPAINGQMQELRSNVLKNVDNIRSQIQLNESSLATQERSINSKFVNIPTKEKKLVELSRMLNIKEAIYTFLLQKKGDKEIELASTQVANSLIIDDGVTGASQFPKALYVYAIAFAIGILLPALVILLRVMLNKKIETRGDVESLTSLPIAGEISNIHDSENSPLVVTPTNVSSEAEQFRTLRTNIYYLTPGLERKTMLVTSSKSGEGKSFVSANLANTMALGNKKVVLLEFDLRTIGLSEKMGVEKTIGLANYLMDDDIDIEDIIQPTKGSENLFFISSGFPLAPNPGELILSSKMEKLFEYLKATFDAIVIDTPPVGPVSDALTLAKWADISFFVIRHKETLLSTLKLINKLHEDQKLPHLKLIINGIKDAKDFNYGNNFGYGYGYEYGLKSKKKRKLVSLN